MLAAFFVFIHILKPSISHLVCILLLQRNGCAVWILTYRLNLATSETHYVRKETHQVRKRKGEYKLGYGLMDESLIEGFCIRDISQPFSAKSNSLRLSCFHTQPPHFRKISGSFCNLAQYLWQKVTESYDYRSSHTFSNSSHSAPAE